MVTLIRRHNSARAFIEAKKWNVTDEITVVFENLNPIVGTDVTITQSGAMDTTNGAMDPLQLEFLQQGNDINIPEAIKKIV